MFSCTFPCHIHVFPHLPVATCFPTFATGYMFSQTIHWLHVFPHSPLSTCFPTLATDYMFSHSCHWLQVFLRQSMVTCLFALMFPAFAMGYSFKFLSFVNGCMFSLACRWLHIFPPLPMVSFFSLFLWTEYDVFSHYSRVTCFFALTGSGNIFLELFIGIVNQLRHTLTTYLSRFLDIYQSQGSYRSFHTIQTMMRMTSQLWTPQSAALARFSCFKLRSETEKMWTTFQ